MTLCVLRSMVRIERDCQFVIQTLSSVLFVKRPCGLLCSAVMMSLICQVAESITTVAPGHFFSGCSAHCSTPRRSRSEEHTSELQSRLHLVCRLLLEKKKKNDYSHRRETTLHMA